MRWSLLVVAFLFGCPAEGEIGLEEEDMAQAQDVGSDFGVVDSGVDADFDASDAEDLGPEYGGPCDPFAQDCEFGKCIPQAAGGGFCAPENVNLELGGACQTTTECIKGAFCADLRGEGPTCWEICQIDAIEAGAADTCSTGACVARVDTYEGLGLCASSTSGL